jgi:hypothetical protein
MKKEPQSCRRLPGHVRRHLVGGPSCIGGILSLVYLLPGRPTDPENPELIRKLPRDLLRTIGPPIPRMSFANGALPPPVLIWRVREKKGNTEVAVPSK